MSAAARQWVTIAASSRVTRSSMIGSAAVMSGSWWWHTNQRIASNGTTSSILARTSWKVMRPPGSKSTDWSPCSIRYT